MLEHLGRWLTDNSSLLSGIAAVAGICAVLLPAVGRSARGVGSMVGRLKPGTAGQAGAAVAALVEHEARTTPLLAVLAFDNLSPDPDMQFFSDGISEEIIQRVSRGARIPVIGRLSSFQFRGERKASATQVLNCTHVLDGSVRRQGGHVRISAHLQAATAHTALWSESYDRALDDLFGVQDDIAQNIARALDQTFARVATPNVPSALYDLYLKSSPQSYAPDELRSHVALLETVTASAPEFIAAWSRLAYLRAWLHLYLPYAERAANAARVNEEAARALAVEPNDIDALVARLFVVPPYGCFAEFDALLARVRSARGHGDGLRYSGWFLRNTGRVREALEDTEQAYRLDMLCPMTINLLALARMAAGKVDQAIPLYEDLVERVPGMSFPVSSLLRAHALRGDWDAVDRVMAIAERRQMREFGDGLLFIRAKREPTDENIDAWRDLVAAQVRDTGTTDVSRLVYTAHLGLVDEAMAFALNARLGPTGAVTDVMGPDGYRTSLLFQHGMPELRNDPRFPRLCARLGLVDFWLQSDTWPDCVDQVPYDFRAACVAARDVPREPLAY